MSAAGSLPFIIYIAVSTIFNNYISARFQYKCLKYCMILYLFPFPLLKYFVCRYVSTPKPLTGDAVISLTGKIIQTSNGFYLNSTGCLQKIFIGLWICSLCVVIFYETPILFILFIKKLRLFFENISVILDFISEPSFAAVIINKYPYHFCSSLEKYFITFSSQASSCTSFISRKKIYIKGL